jgi:hypothetical protein
MAKPGTQTTCNVTVTVSHFAKAKLVSLLGTLLHVQLASVVGSGTPGPFC